MATLRRFAAEPLVHFFALGALLFALFTWLNEDSLRRPDEILVDAARVAQLEAQFERVWRRPPQPDERQGLIDSWIREEILYREGLALGLDRNDPVIRRRIGQKLEFIADGMVPPEPTEEELEAFLAEHAGRYRVEATHTLRQVFVDPRRHGEGIDEVLADVRAALDRGEAPDALGDPTLLPATVDSARTTQIARVFGERFAAAIEALTPGRWHGPVPSTYGTHFVRVEARTPARAPDLAEVRQAVERDWLQARAEEVGDAFYRSLRERYTVRMETPGPSEGTAPPATVASEAQ